MGARKCEQCGKEFSPNTVRHRFCSSRCKDVGARRRIVSRVPCAECGRPRRPNNIRPICHVCHNSIRIRMKYMTPEQLEGFGGKRTYIPRKPKELPQDEESVALRTLVANLSVPQSYYRRPRCIHDIRDGECPECERRQRAELASEKEEVLDDDTE